MNEITTAITGIKTKLSLHEWQQRIIDCQNSGMSVKAWCHENGISTGSYYYHLRKTVNLYWKKTTSSYLYKSPPITQFLLHIPVNDQHVHQSDISDKEKIRNELGALDIRYIHHKYRLC